MDEIRVDTLDQYNKLYGLETLHLLVGVVDLTQVTTFPNRVRLNMGVYSLFLKQTLCGDLKYGKKLYDYQEGTIVSFAPGQVIGVELKENVRLSSVGIVFHPDLIRGTSLGENIKQYSFFSYEVNEALHVSEEERQIILDCFDKVRIELPHAIDKHSKMLIAKNSELLLDYCMRFYERQFHTRSKANKDILIGFAKDRIVNTDQTVSEMALGLGFQYARHFSRLFRKNVGCSPSEYKKLNT